MKILLATDGSSTADAALDVVLYRPWEDGTEVRVISIVEPLNQKLNQIVGLFGLAKTAAESQQRLKQMAADLVESYAAKLRARFGADKVTAAVLEGRSRETLTKEATDWKADTVVLGAHGKNETDDYLFGSVPEHVLSHSKCSVEILRAPSPSTVLTELARNQPVEEDKYLVALDDSDCSAATLDEILKRKWPPKPFFKVISVVEPLPFHSYTGLGPWEGAGSEEYVNLVTKTLEAEQSVAKKVVADAMAKLKEKFEDATVTGEVFEGFARDQIITTANEWPADLIIMGSHGRGGFMEFVLGSVSKGTSTHAPCSVLIVRSPTSTKVSG